MASASGNPTKRGKRCVPPHPGIMPNLTSGKPILVFGLSVAKRKLHANASSQPPPTQAPSITATVVCGNCSRALKIFNPCCAFSFAISTLSICCSSSIAAPAIKISFLALSKLTTFCGAVSISLITSNSSFISSADSLLIA